MKRHWGLWMLTAALLVGCAGAPAAMNGQQATLPPETAGAGSEPTDTPTEAGLAETAVPTEMAQASPVPTEAGVTETAIPTDTVQASAIPPMMVLRTINDQGQFDLVVDNGYTGETLRLTNDVFSEFSHAISPDGTRIAYESFDSTKWRSSLIVMNVDGSDRQVLQADVLPIYNVIWSPDGQQIIYQSNQPCNSETCIVGQDIYAFNLADHTITTLGTGSTSNEPPLLSPDGRRLVFSTFGSEASPGGLYVANADGSDPVRVDIPSEASVLGFGWSPDSARLAFTLGICCIGSNESGDPMMATDIHIANADGTGVERLTGNIGDEYSPAWINGHQLVFTSNAGDPISSGQLSRDEFALWLLDVEPRTAKRIGLEQGGIRTVGSIGGCGSSPLLILLFDADFSTAIASLDPATGDVTIIGDGYELVDAVSITARCLNP